MKDLDWTAPLLRSAVRCPGNRHTTARAGCMRMSAQAQTLACGSIELVGHTRLAAED
jgi:hypothetical protein